MFHRNMFESAGTIARFPNFLRFSLRRNATTAKEIIRRRKEDKDNFGPLLETAREKKRCKRLQKTKTIEHLEKVESNNDTDAELSWTIDSTKVTNLRLVKKNKENHFNIIRIRKLSKLSRLLGVNDYTHNCGVDITNLVLNEIFPKTEKKVDENDGKINSGKSEIPGISVNHTDAVDKIVPFSKDNVITIRDGVALMDDDDKSCVFEMPASTDSSYFPIINLSKDHDRWQGDEIVCLRPTDQSQMYLPGVTTILNETMSEKTKLMLEWWKKKMILQLGEQGFKEYCEKLLQDGNIMHELIAKTLKRESLPAIPQHLKSSYNSIKLILKDLTDIRMIESHVVHPQLGYRGFVDCVANYRGNLCIIDWKKSERIKTLSTTYDSPLQVSAYIGALNADPNYSFQVRCGLLAIAYTRGQPPSAFEFSAARLEFYWREWLKRLKKYKLKKK